MKYFLFICVTKKKKTESNRSIWFARRKWIYFHDGFGKHQVLSYNIIYRKSL